MKHNSCVPGSPNRDIYSPRDRHFNKHELSSISPPSATYDGCTFDDSLARLCKSQPEPRLEQPTVPVSSVAAAMQKEKASFSFSQPAYLDDMLLNSQLHATQPSTQSSNQVVFSGVLYAVQVVHWS
jgi:hypothetical protein